MDEPTDFPIRGASLERPLPSSPDAERELNGCIFLDNSLIAEAVELLVPKDFYVPSQRYIHEGMISLFNRGEPIDNVTLPNELLLAGKLEQCGGILGLTNLTNGLWHRTTIAPLARIIKDKSSLRELLAVANKITADVLEEDELPEQVRENASKAIFNITSKHAGKAFTSIATIAHRAISDTYEMQQAGKSIVGLPTGFLDLDVKTLGWRKQDLIVIAARPGMGKTTLALNLAVHAAVQANAVVGIHSLEMAEDELSKIMICSEARVDNQRFHAAVLNQEEWDKVSAAEMALANMKIFIDETPAVTPSQVKAKCMRLAVDKGRLDLIIIDYLQLMGTGDKSRNSNREQDVAEISRQLKSIAKELDVPVITLCQLNRSPENRADHRPLLSDLRESGAIEQDSDLVMFIYREDYYRNKTQIAENTNIAEIIIAKQRKGPLGTIALRFDGPTGRFDDLYQHH